MLKNPESFKHAYGPWAIITGAANGLGAEFARQIAAYGIHLVLVDIDELGLEATAAELRSSNLEIKTLVADLSQPDFIEPLLKMVHSLDVGLLVNNAGISTIGLFAEGLLSDHLRVMQVNVQAPLILAHAFTERLKARKRGGMIFVSSLSALQGTAYVANYAATKAWNLIFAEGLWDELRNDGVDVLGYLVGSTRTPGFEASKPMLERASYVKVMNVNDTVADALSALGRSPSSIAGRMNRILMFILLRLLSRRRLTRMVSATTRALYETRK